MQQIAVAVNGRFGARPVTGVERYAQEITRRLPQSVRVIAPAIRIRGAAGHAWEQLRLPRLLRPHEVLWSPANSGPLRAARHVVTIHDVSVLEHPEWFSRRFGWWHRTLLPPLVRRARAVITVSAFSKARLVDCLGVPEERIVAIPNGVDATFQPIDAAERLPVLRRYRLHRPYILTVGSLEPRKNLVRLCEAWRRIAPGHPGIDLVIAGRAGPSFRHIRAIDRAGSRIRLLGAISDADLPSLYSGALVFAWPSLYEGFGLPVLEAMACGVPVVTSAGSALPEVAGEAGLLVDPTCVDAIAGALDHLIRDPSARARHRELGLARARRFTWERAAAKTWQVLARVLVDPESSCEPLA